MKTNADEIFRASVQVVVERSGAPQRWGSGVVIAAQPARFGAESWLWS